MNIFKHGLNDTTNPICVCGSDFESINHFFLHCPEYCEARQPLFDKIQSIDKILLSQNKSSLTHLLLYGDPSSNVKAFILNSALEFVLSSGRFNGPVFNGALNCFFFFSFSNSFFIWLSVWFCLFILFCYILFVLISQVFVTFLLLVSLAVSVPLIIFLFS